MVGPNRTLKFSSSNKLTPHGSLCPTSSSFFLPATSMDGDNNELEDALGMVRRGWNDGTQHTPPRQIAEECACTPVGAVHRRIRPTHQVPTTHKSLFLRAHTHNTSSWSSLMAPSAAAAAYEEGHAPSHASPAPSCRRFREIPRRLQDSVSEEERPEAWGRCRFHSRGGWWLRQRHVAAEEEGGDVIHERGEAKFIHRTCRR